MSLPRIEILTRNPLAERHWVNEVHELAAGQPVTRLLVSRLEAFRFHALQSMVERTTPNRDAVEAMFLAYAYEDQARSILEGLSCF